MLVELGTLGARARPFNAPLKSNILVIGLGQIGLHAVSCLDGMLAHTLPPRERREHTRLLAIAQRQSIRQEQLLPRENRLLIDTDHMRWTDIPGRYAQLGVAQWWPRTPNHPELQADPTSTRAFSRLLLWTNTELVGEKLYEVAEWLHLSGQRTDYPCKVLIVASLAEPEGSGMIFDIAGRLRALLHNTPVSTAGIFTVDVDCQNEDEQLLAMANVYACFKEIDAANLQPESYPHDLPVVGRPHSLPTVSQKPLLDYICVTGEVSQPIANPHGALAEFVLTWIISETALYQDAPLLPALPTHIDSQHRYNGYTTFGVAKLGLPVRAALDYFAVETATGVLNALLMRYQKPVEPWVRRIISRAHDDLFTTGLIEHHLMIDKLRELRRRLLPDVLKIHVSGGERASQNWQTLLEQEWQRLLLENEPLKHEFDGTTTNRDVIRRRMDDAMEANTRKLVDDLEDTAVKLAFSDGWGLVWTHSAYAALSNQIKKEIEAMEKHIYPAEMEMQTLRNRWFEAGSARDMEALENLGKNLIQSVAVWISWQARVATWVNVHRAVQNLVARFEYAMQQVPNDIERLNALSSELQTELQLACKQEPTFPVGTLCAEEWIQDGLRNITPPHKAAPQQLVQDVFKRWYPEQVAPARQLQKFPAEVLTAVRLMLQPQSSFLSVHDFLMNYNGVVPWQQVLDNMTAAAAPSWALKAVTNKLDDSVPPPQAIEIMRETPGPFSAFTKPGYQRIIHHVIPSPDPDELLAIRITHGWTAEHVPQIRSHYRRAYYRISADNIPLHIDRRWETTMPDLIHTTMRSEFSTLWEEALRTPPIGMVSSINKLSYSLASALDADMDHVQLLPSAVPQIQLYVFPLEPFRLKIPPPLCAFVFLLDRRGTAEVTQDLQRTVSAAMLEENFFFVVNVVGRTDVDKLLEPLRAQSYMPLELTEPDVKHIASAPKPTDALRDMVISRINLTAISPFYTRAPVPDHMFFGREQEIADVRSKLATHSVVLIGGRRIGKTSTLQKIKRALDISDSPIMPYYLDCSNVLEYRHLFRRIAREWGVSIRDKDDPVEFDEVVDALTTRHLDKMPVFLLDEVDRLLKTDQSGDHDEPLFRTFRSLSNEKRCQFVFSGEKLLTRSINNPYSVMFNFPKHVKLGALNKDVVQRLVTEPFEMLNIWLEEVDALIQQIYEISAGHPNIVQTICHALVEIIDSDNQANLLKRSHLGKVLDQHQVQVDIVETIWGQMHPLARLITLLWQENVRQMSLQDIINLLGKAGVKRIQTRQIMDDVLPDLELYNFIRQEGQMYTLIPIFFPTIIDFMTDKKMEIRAILETQE